MARLLNEANKLDSTILGKGVTVDEKFEDVSFDQMIRAIHVVQQQMGITGTTSKEAAGTIEGSVRSMSAAWENLKTNLATGDDEKVNSLIDTLVLSVETAAQNVIPRLEIIVDGIGKMIERVAPIITEKLPDLMNTILPAIISAATSMITTLAKNLPALIKAVIPPLVKGVKEVLAAIKTVLPDMLAAVKEIMPEIISALVEALPMVIESGAEIIGALVDGVLENIDMILTAAESLIMRLANGLIEKLPKMMPRVVEIVLGIVDKLTQPDTLDNLIDAALKLLGALADGLIKSLPVLLDKVPTILTRLINALVEKAPEIFVDAIEIIAKLADALLSNLDRIWDAGVDILGELWDGVWSMIKTLIDGFIGIGKDIAEEVGKWISEAYNWGKDLLGNFINGAKEWFMNTEWFKFWEYVGESIADFMAHSTPEKGALKNDDEWGIDFMQNFIDGAQKKSGELVNTVSGIASAVSDAMEISGNGMQVVTFIQPALDAMNKLAYGNGKDFISRFADGIRDNSAVVARSIEDSMQFTERIESPAVQYQEGAQTAQAESGTSHYYNVSITIDGAGRNADDIAEEVAERLRSMEQLENMKAGVIAL